MPTFTFEQFFAGKHFQIPPFQREYAWEVNPHIDDLFEDLLETVYIRRSSPQSSSANHYLGSFILHQKPANGVYAIVDGQQRLTTMTMILNVLITRLSNQREKIINEDKFIVSNGKRRLELSNINNRFFVDLLSGNQLKVQSRSQRFLKEAYSEICRRIDDLAINKVSEINELLKAIRYCDVQEYIELDESRAIRIFQTVNDRGKRLSNMEKTKSLLIYYSSKYLSNSLDSWINDEFGNIFRVYDEIK